MKGRSKGEDEGRVAAVRLPAETGVGSPQRRRARRWPALFLPPLTAALFVALSGLSLFENARRDTPAAGFKTPEAVSAEVIARYRKESERLAELRAARRKDTTVADLLRFLSHPRGERAYPAVATLAGDFRALCRRDRSAPSRLLLAAVDAVEKEIAAGEKDTRALEILTALIEQAAFSLREPVGLGEAQRVALTAVLEWSARSQPRGAVALLHVLRLEGGRDSACRIEEIAAGLSDAQLRGDFEATARALREEPRGDAS